MFGIMKSIAVEETTNLNSYIANLGFNPTRICVTLGVLNEKYVSMFSQATMNAISQGMSWNKTNRVYGSNYCLPELGVFMSVNQKVFAVRSSKEETMPKVYSFSQLQYFELSQDLRESMRGAFYGSGIAMCFGGNLKGYLSMRVVFSGANGPESVTLKPEMYNGIEMKINHPVYKFKLEQMTAIADCLQWIHNNA